MSIIKNKVPIAVTDKVAIALAGKIIGIQRRLSAFLNAWFNGYSSRKKKCILMLLCLVVFLVLLSGVFSSFNRMPLLSQNYSSTHIGQASDTPKPQTENSQITDSLTKKSKSWKQP